MELGGLGATRRLAESVAAVLQRGDVVGLDGDLGAGKTTFVRYLARALGVTTPVTSPTFTLANTYEAPDSAIPIDRRSGEGRNPPSSNRPDDALGPPLLIHHIDAYRLEGDADAEDLALAELLDSGAIVVVEWAERLTLPPDRLDIYFEFPPEPDVGDHRIATISPRGACWRTRPVGPVGGIPTDRDTEGPGIDGPGVGASGRHSRDG